MAPDNAKAKDLLNLVSKMHKPMNDEKCQEVLMNLLMIRDMDASSLPAFYLRELWQTSRCPAFERMARVRDDYVQALGTETVERILRFQETDEDMKRSAQEVLHNWRWDGKSIRNCLTYPRWATYWLIDKPGSILHLFGLGGGCYGGVRLASVLQAFLRRRVRPPAS